MYLYLDNKDIASSSIRLHSRYMHLQLDLPVHVEVQTNVVEISSPSKSENN